MGLPLLNHLEFYLLSRGQGPVSLTSNGAVVDEDIALSFTKDKPISAGRVEPLHSAGLSVIGLSSLAEHHPRSGLLRRYSKGALLLLLQDPSGPEQHRTRLVGPPKGFEILRLE